MLNLCNALLSIIFSVILRLDTPNEWQPLFGSPLQACSIRRFWTKFWHRLTVSCCASSGTQVTRRLIGMTPGCRSEKIFVAFWTFLLSGLCHVIADWQAGEPCHPHDDLLFFVANFMASALELLVVRRLERVKGYRADHDKDIWSVLLKTTNRVVGVCRVVPICYHLATTTQSRIIITTTLLYTLAVSVAKPGRRTFTVNSGENTMLNWLRKLFGADNAALDRRSQQRRSRKRSKQMRAREQELRRQNQRQELKGGKHRTPFFWGSPGVTTPVHQTRIFE
ncbi:hypothetical protein AFLA_004950 [Aspergillus flavus NRRL3357]|nr:hypothetical protein AFLA_004950 [Aspergillus flavus NRRL3357]